MAEKMDLRVRMTRKLLTDSLAVLLCRVPFENLSVVDICQEAQIHRTTFYKHFEDKEHLLRSLFAQTQEEWARQKPETADFHPYYVQICGQILEHIAKNAAFFKTGVFGEGNETVREVFHQAMVDYLTGKLTAYAETSGRRFTLPAAVLAEYSAGSLAALAVWWLKNNMFVPVTEMISYLDAISGGAILLPEK